MMSEDTLVQAIMDARAQVDFLWQFFVTVHIAIFALILIYGEAVDRLSWVGRVVSAVGIGVFEFINGKALVNAYLMIDAMHKQYRWSYGQVERFHASFYEQFVLATFEGRPSMVLVTHTSALLIVGFAFLTQHLMRQGPSHTQSW